MKILERIEKATNVTELNIIGNDIKRGSPYYYVLRSAWRDKKRQLNEGFRLRGLRSPDEPT